MIETARVLSVRKYKAGYEVRKEVWRFGTDETSDTEIRAAYTPQGDYIGDPKTARRLCVERGIAPEKAKPTHCVCSIGYAKKQRKWYGWSHRALFGFAVGSKVKEGDCGFEARGAWTAKNLADARQMAIDFAESVS